MRDVATQKSAPAATAAGPPEALHNSLARNTLTARVHRYHARPPVLRRTDSREDGLRIHRRRQAEESREVPVDSLTSCSSRFRSAIASSRATDSFHKIVTKIPLDHAPQAARMASHRDCRMPTSRDTPLAAPSSAIQLSLAVTQGKHSRKNHSQPQPVSDSVTGCVGRNSWGMVPLVIANSGKPSGSRFST